MQETIEALKKITRPFADGWDHVQGPGGNTSVKENNTLVIKASGFTFRDLLNDEGYVAVDNASLLADFAHTYDDGLLEGTPSVVIGGAKEGLRPSMEYEFHAVLKPYVLHTHSVYANVVLCSSNCASLLEEWFPDIPYVLVPYVMPGHPLASYIYKKLLSGVHASVFFLKNHGIIVHGDTAEEVLALYDAVQQRIIDRAGLAPISASYFPPLPDNGGTLQFSDVSTDPERVQIADLRDHIVVPDQSIFFRGKLSEQPGETSIFFNTAQQQIEISGSPKFFDAAVSAMRMVFYIRNNQARLSWKADYIPTSELSVLHGLSSEKYRVSIF